MSNNKMLFCSPITGEFYLMTRKEFMSGKYPSSNCTEQVISAFFQWLDKHSKEKGCFEYEIEGFGKLSFVKARREVRRNDTR